MAAPLAVFGELALLTHDGEAITITADQSLVRVELPSAWPWHRAWGPLADRRLRARVLASLHRGLCHADLTLEVRVRRRVVARLRPQSQQTWLSRLLGLGAVEVRVIPSLRALLRR